MKSGKTKEITEVIKRLPSYSKLIYRLYKESDVTKAQKAWLATAIGYLISPVELVPGFIPVAGQLDDIIIVLTILRSVLKKSDETFAIKILQSYNLSFEIIDSDINVSKKVAKNIIKSTRKLVGNIMMASGKSVYKMGKWLLKKDKPE